MNLNEFQKNNIIIFPPFQVPACFFYDRPVELFLHPSSFWPQNIVRKEKALNLESTAPTVETILFTGVLRVYGEAQAFKIHL